MLSKIYLKILLIIFLFVPYSFASNHLIPVPKTVVKCSLANCPTISPILNPDETLSNEAIIFQTSKNNPEFMVRFKRFFSNKSNNGWQSIVIDQTEYHDTFPVIGFGGSFSDAAAILYQNMSPGLKKLFIQAYFSAEGLAYSLARVPMASHDFSCRAKNGTAGGVPHLINCDANLSRYSYHDAPDESLKFFALQPEDLQFKIPMIQDALTTIERANGSLKLLASPWSAPAWMKTNNNMVHGSLKPALQQTWANYFIKFLQAYKTHQIIFWGVTVQNEPEENAFQQNIQSWQTMFYTPAEEANFIKNHLGPSLDKFEEDYGSKINLLMHDDQITTIPERFKMLLDNDVLKYVAGAGLHWYTTNDLNLSNLDDADNILNTFSSPNRFIIGTEACQGYMPGDNGPRLGSWSRGESYAHDIINDLNHHVSGWTDWNLVLDMNGGPNWAKNYVDAPVLFDLQAQMLYLQPMYFYLGHFSKFIRPASKLLVSLSRGPVPLEEVTYRVPAYGKIPETIVVVVLNRDNFERYYYLKDISKKSTETYLNMHIPAHAIQTIIYKVEHPNQH